MRPGSTPRIASTRYSDRRSDRRSDRPSPVPPRPGDEDPKHGTGFADNDAGGTATYSLAGAEFGYDLLWVLLASQIALASGNIFLIMSLAAAAGVRRLWAWSVLILTKASPGDRPSLVRGRVA